MANSQLLSAVREDTSEIKAGTTAIKADTEEIKQDTQQINILVQEIAFLRLQVSQLKRESGSAGVTLQRFLDETSSYAESAVDATDLGEVDPNETRSLSAISEEDSDIDRIDEPARPVGFEVAETRHPLSPKAISDRQSGQPYEIRAGALPEDLSALRDLYSYPLVATLEPKESVASTALKELEQVHLPQEISRFDTASTVVEQFPEVKEDDIRVS
jgi:hypothetical protein